MTKKSVGHVNLNERLQKLKDYTIDMKKSLNSFEERVQEDAYLRNNPEVQALRDELMQNLSSLNAGIEVSQISKESFCLDI